MSKSRTLALGLALVLALGVGSAFAQKTPPPINPNPGATKGKTPTPPSPPAIKLPFDLAFLYKGLNLTDDQKWQFKAIYDATLEASTPLDEQLPALKEQFEQAIKDHNLAGIEAAATAIAQLQAQVMGIQGTALAKSYQLLTPEQKTKLEELLALLKDLKTDGGTPPVKNKGSGG